MAVNLSPVAGAAAQFFDNSGQVLTGGKLYTYDAGTTTPAPTYTNSSGVTAQPNPIVLNAAGRVPDSGEIWLSDSISYKFVLKDQNDVLIGTYDNLVGINSNFVNFTGEEETQTATQGQTIFTLATLQYTPATNNLLVFVNGSKQVIGDNFVETSSTVVTFVDGLNVGDIVDFCTATPINTSVTTAAQVSYNEGAAGAVTRTVESKLQESISILDFGADPTGATDSTTAIQNAINSVELENATLYIPTGVYIITSSLSITNVNGLTIIGDGPHASIIRLVTTGQSISGITTGSSLVGGISVDKLTLSNFRIEPSNTYASFIPTSTFYGKNGIELTNCQHWFLNNVDIWYFNGNGLQLDESYIGTAENCHIAGNNGWGIYSGTSSQGANYSSHATNIVFNEIQGNKTGGIYINGPTSPVVSFNTIETNTNVGIDIVYALSPTIIGNYFESNNSYGIRVGNTSLIPVGGVIESNSFQNNSIAGIYLDSVYNMTVKGNFFYATTLGILATTNTTYCELGPNHNSGVSNSISATNSYQFNLGTLTVPSFSATDATSGSYKTANGNTISVASGVATTLFTLSSNGIYQIYAYINNANDAANFSAYAVILKEGTSQRIAVSQNATLMNITLSGANVQATQTSGSTNPITYVYHKISA